LFARQGFLRLGFACSKEHVPSRNCAVGLLEHRYTGASDPEATGVAEVGILIIDDDLASQGALKNILDTEGWRVRILPLAADAMPELATGAWNLAIVNVTLLDLRGPLFSTLKALAQAELTVPEAAEESPRKRIRVLFLVPLIGAKGVQAVLEREGLPYSLKPYHLNDFLEKISELLVEAGAIAEPIRRNFFESKKRLRDRRDSHDGRRGAMFAPRGDYQMSEDEMAEFERQEDAERKQREIEQKNREHL
jgi:DNA-binding response OmpR family regulator